MFLNVSGTAIYVFGFVVPLIDLPSTLGATFAIDGERFQMLTSDIEYPSPCSTVAPIFSRAGLSNDREHELLVSILPSWKFFLDSITFTRSSIDSASPPFPPTTLAFAPSSRNPPKFLRPRTEEAAYVLYPSTSDNSTQTLLSFRFASLIKQSLCIFLSSIKPLTSCPTEQTQIIPRNVTLQHSWQQSPVSLVHSRLSPLL